MGDGILGLAYGTISVDHLPVFVESADLTDRSFAFYLHNNPEQSYMTMPGIDESLNLEKIYTHDVVQKTYWNVNLDSFIGPNSIISPLIDGIKVHRLCRGIEDLPDITFTMDGIDYVLTWEDYVVQVTQDDQTQCIMGIAGADLPDDFKYVIVGDVFMRKYPTHFNKNDNTVTFYKSN